MAEFRVVGNGLCPHPLVPSPSRGEGEEEARRAVFLDRDGTLNAMVYDPDHGTADSPLRPEELALLPGALEAVRQINELGLLAVVVSNQPVVAKGKISLALLDAITAKLRSDLGCSGARLDASYYCLHHPEAVIDEYGGGPCTCRKPAPGLLLQAAVDLDIDLPGSYMVGDGLNDVEAGQAAGCVTIWLGHDKCDWCAASLEHAVRRPDRIATNLRAAVDAVASLEANGGPSHADLHRFGRHHADQRVAGIWRSGWGNHQPLDHAQVRRS